MASLGTAPSSSGPQSNIRVNYRSTNLNFTHFCGGHKGCFITVIAMIKLNTGVRGTQKGFSVMLTLASTPRKTKQEVHATRWTSITLLLGWVSIKATMQT